MVRTTFTSITPLPPGISRETALRFLHNHTEMIDLNPLVIERHPITPPEYAEAEEHTCVWYSITDKISYLPGTDLVRGDVTYTCAFHDLPQGLQTHCYAAMGLEIRDKWTIGGSAPGEEPEVQELGIGAPAAGLYIREDVDFRCNYFMAGFIKKTLKKAHATLVDAVARKAQRDPGQGPGPQDAGGWGHPPENDAPPFVSSGGNQGQPGQGRHERPYHPPQLSQSGAGTSSQSQLPRATSNGNGYGQPEQSLYDSKEQWR